MTDGCFVDAVIFDYGGVLKGEDFEAFSAARGLPPGLLWAAFHEIPEYRDSREGRIDRAAYRVAVERALAAALGLDRARGAIAAWDREFDDTDPIEPEMRVLLARLREAGRVRLGLLSNSTRGREGRLRENGVAALFDAILCSGDAGVMKPHPASYRLMAERLGVRAERCFMIDDAPTNVEAARALGLRAHLFEHDRLPRLIAELEELRAL
jgi:putative hydrolase of the HAD superfamily